MYVIDMSCYVMIYHVMWCSDMLCAVMLRVCDDVNVFI